MLLWRIDAEHDSGDGAWSLLYRSQTEAEMHACRYSQTALGWLIDIYAEEAGHLDPQTADRLCNVLWPILPIPELIEIANHPVAAAKERLNELLDRNRNARLVWESK